MHGLGFENVNRTEINSLSRVRASAFSGQARQTRLSAHLSLSELAKVCGVDASTVWRWEQGKRVPRGEPALRYARVLDTLAHAQAAGEAEW
ncbi:helix-turn-helix domain-containing protein [Streptomyces luteireticuli]|uniref:helix-turn-helix domain-containing protein n=1 Tax=Streptomyces luteireticuli TaxID=173858 RepID=UPI003556B520